MEFWTDNGASLLSELGLDYEMQNTLLAAANDQGQLRQMVVDQNPLDNFTASGEIWPGHRNPSLPSLTNMPLPLRTPSPSSGSLVGALTLPNDALDAQPFSLPTVQRTASGKLTARMPQRALGYEEKMDIDGSVGPVSADVAPLFESNTYVSPHQFISAAGEKRKAASASESQVSPPSASSTPATQKRRKIMTVGDDEDGSPDNNNDDMDDMDDEFQRSFPNEEERRRYAHIHAEQKRRNNIKQAFLDLKDVLPNYKDKPNVSKAMILKAATDFIRNSADYRAEVYRLRAELDELRNSGARSAATAANAARKAAAASAGASGASGQGAYGMSIKGGSPAGAAAATNAANAGAVNRQALTAGRRNLSESNFNEYYD